MRKLPIFIVATSVVSVVVAVAAATHFLSTTPLKLDASAPPELTTGAIEARWPKPGIERPTAAAEPMPSVQPAETTLQVTGNRPVLAKPACNNPNALGISRTVQIDTGDQIDRLFSEPAELLVLQHCHEITPPVRGMMRAYAQQMGRPRLFCLINGYDTLRVLEAYGKCGLMPRGQLGDRT